jgi:hypothetical protein
MYDPSLGDRNRGAGKENEEKAGPGSDPKNALIWPSQDVGWGHGIKSSFHSPLRRLGNEQNIRSPGLLIRRNMGRSHLSFAAQSLDESVQSPGIFISKGVEDPPGHGRLGFQEPAFLHPAVL